MKISSSLITAALLGALPTIATAADAKAEGAEAKKAPPAKTVSIFNGKDLEGWTHDPLGKANYEVVDGAIVGTTVEGSPNSFLLSEKEYGDFELTFEVQVDDGLNSGVQIRSRPKSEADVAGESSAKTTPPPAAKRTSEKAKGKKGASAPAAPAPGKNSSIGRVFGPQVEIEMSPGQAGYIYGEATSFGWLSPEPADKEHSHEHVKNGEWNQFRILARGPRIQTWINGEKVADLTHEEIYKTHPRGHFGLQVHGIKAGTGPFSVRWKNIQVKEFPSAQPVAKKAPPTPSVRSDLPGDYFVYSPESDTKLYNVEENALITIKGGKGSLWTKEPFGDVMIDLEVKLSEGCNSGVFVRSDPMNPVQAGFEIQVFDSAGVAEAGKHDFGAFYDAQAPLVNAAKPAGEWNHLVIEWKGPHLTVHLNDQKVQDLNVDEWTTANLNPDGSKNKFGTALKDLPRTGHVGFQNHGHDVWFRNVSITALLGTGLTSAPGFMRPSQVARTPRAIAMTQVTPAEKTRRLPRTSMPPRASQTTPLAIAKPGKTP